MVAQITFAGLLVLTVLWIFYPFYRSATDNSNDGWPSGVWLFSAIVSCIGATVFMFCLLGTR